jgi:hypothetical protein
LQLDRFQRGLVAAMRFGGGGWCGAVRLDRLRRGIEIPIGLAGKILLQRDDGVDQDQALDVELVGEQREQRDAGLDALEATRMIPTMMFRGLMPPKTPIASLSPIAHQSRNRRFCGLLRDARLAAGQIAR